MNEQMKNLPKDQRPYEKCLREGAEALSDGELLAVVLRTGTKEVSAVSLANRLLRMTEETAYPGLPGILHLSIAELKSLDGIGDVKAIQLKCVGELCRRMATAAARPGISFTNPTSIASYYMERLRHEEQEHLYCMMLDNRNHLLGEYLLSLGTANATLITPREIFIEALKQRALGVILVHNHPSGEPSPSASDREVTDRVYQMGEMLGIHLLDHIIIGDQRYYSFREQGLIDEDAI
ncbi:MAG: DNA repair protein RadC [Eubacteriales bacterium]|nr:DNA repair protein RadC [Eubacteriales bacterium]